MYPAGRGDCSGSFFPIGMPTPSYYARDLCCRASGPPAGIPALVGLGPGFTPSGDDFAAGVLLARTLTGTGIDPAEREAIRSRLPGTAPGGRSLLLGAVDGRFPDYLVRFSMMLKQACAADPEAGRAAVVADAVRAAVAHGETSGSDSLAGLLYALGGAMLD